MSQTQNAYKEERKQRLLKEYRKIAVNELHIAELPEVVSLVNKDDILAFLADHFYVAFPKKTAKSELVTEAIKRLSKKRNMIKNFYWEFDEEISIHPIQLEDRLRINTYRRKKMMDNGELIISTYDYLRKYGKDLYVPRYDRYLVLGQHHEAIVKMDEGEKNIS
ncbi:hypothetical protein D3C74_137810 [compost metagenome]